ncbi:hypothetical protein C8Q75DRAFT_806254 [Abortiporus biennis]|nr:hypothetical protein C8Q75DRAFT_806254 [Abortiporus biennis]
MPLPNGRNFTLSVTYSVADAAGINVLVAVSAFSLIGVIILLGAIATSAWNTRRSINPHMFVRSHAAAYLVSLLISVGSLMNSKWNAELGVTFGPSCTAQGFIKHFSDVGTAIWSLIIAFHTFWILFLRLETKKTMLVVTLIVGWGLILLLVIIGPATANAKQKGEFYGISGYWCWISDGYDVLRIGLDYCVMFVSALLSFLFYTAIYLRLRGNLQIDGWKFYFSRRRNLDERRKREAERNKELKDIAKQMLWYPVAYTLMVFPIAICRFVAWGGNPVSFAATIFCDSIFLLSGLANVILFYTTRRVLPPHSVITTRLPEDWTVQGVTRSLSRKFSRRSNHSATSSDASSTLAPSTIDLDKDITGDIEKLADGPTPFDYTSHDHVQMEFSDEYSGRGNGGGYRSSFDYRNHRSSTNSDVFKSVSHPDDNGDDEDLPAEFSIPISPSAPPQLPPIETPTYHFETHLVGEEQDQSEYDQSEYDDEHRHDFEHDDFTDDEHHFQRGGVYNNQLEPKTPLSARPGSARPGSARPGSARPGSARPPNSARPHSARPAQLNLPNTPSEIHVSLESGTTGHYTESAYTPSAADELHHAQELTIPPTSPSRVGLRSAPLNGSMRSPAMGRELKQPLTPQARSFRNLP